MSDALLRLTDVTIRFGGLTAVSSVTADVREGELAGLIGPNGAGKSTFVGLVTGLVKPSAGTVALNGQDITGMSPQQRVKAGLVRTFQINTLFPSLTPLESVVNALCQRDNLARPGWRALARQGDTIEEAQALLTRFALGEHALTTTRELAYGQQRQLEVALAYALRPSVLLLDEPAAGLTTAQGHALFEHLATLAEGTTLLFIEHDMNLVFGFADRVSVLAGGALIAQGTPDEIRADEGVRRAYLG